MDEDRNRRELTEGLFRQARAYLSDDVLLRDGPANDDAHDLIDAEVWRSVIDPPTDVLLRTTDSNGLMIDDMHNQWAAWLDAVPLDERVWPFFHDAYTDVLDEFQAAPFIAAHGFYRQAGAGLRNALEIMARAARFAVRLEEPGYRAWRGRIGAPPRFGNCIDILGQTPEGRRIDTRLGGAGLFGVNPDGVMRDLYASLSGFSHAHPGSTNGDIWRSNGPVYRFDAFVVFWGLYCDTSLACFALLKMSFPSTTSTAALLDHASSTLPGTHWHGLAEATVRALSLDT
ncbi:hypothetical protein GCM10028798_27750 [Humibacter antri]